MDNLTVITRRRALQVLPSITVAAASTAAASAAPGPEMTPRQRVDYLVEELKAALLAADPDVRIGLVGVYLEDRSMPLPFIFTANWVTGRYEGDGIYRSAAEYDPSSRYRVRLLDHPVDGQRGFSVIQLGERDRSKWMKLSESHFETFIGKKVGWKQVAA